MTRKVLRRLEVGAAAGSGEGGVGVGGGGGENPTWPPVGDCRWRTAGGEMETF